jgi:hypothetical protein
MQQMMCRVSISLKSNIAYEEIPMAVRAAKRLSPIIPAGHPPAFLKTQAENKDKDAEDNGASKRCLPRSQMLIWEVVCCDQLSHLGSFHCGHFQSCNLGDPTKRTQLAALLTPSASHPRDLAVFARRGRRLASQRDAPGSTHSQRHDGGSAVVACAVCVVGVCVASARPEPPECGPGHWHFVISYSVQVQNSPGNCDNQPKNCDIFTETRVIFTVLGV